MYTHIGVVTIYYYMYLTLFTTMA